MTKESEFTALQSASSKPSGSTAAAAAAASGSAQSPSVSSPSSSATKYQVGFTNASTTSPSSSGQKVRSASQNVSSQNASSILAMMKKTSTNARISMLAIGITPGAIETVESSAKSPPSSPKAKLPQKLRQHVTRLRSQFALVTSPSASFNTKSGFKLVHRVSGLSGGGGLSPTKQSQEKGGSSAVGGVSSRALNPKTSPTATTMSSNEPKYSSQSRKMQTLQAQLSMLKMSTREVLKNTTTSSNTEPGHEGEPALFASRPSFAKSPLKEDGAVHFFDLLRPLQNSLSCASLMSEWASDDEEVDGGDGGEDDDQHQQLRSQSPERHRSRMLRICCSVDNLLLSIGNQVQEEKHDEAIARGAARGLLELFQFAIQQVAAISTTAAASGVSDHSDTLNNNNFSSRSGGHDDDDGKELQYMQEFTLEIVERMNKLDQFVRFTFLNEIDGLKDQIEHNELEMADLKQANTQLQTEMTDLREFHSQSNLSGLGFARNSSNSLVSAGGDPKATAGENQERMSNMFPNAAAVATSDSSNKVPSLDIDKLQKLHEQCDEFARLLEMAKQEIRLCHREHDVQKSRIAELSNAMFRDQELTALRNQLQSEKRRVKTLEIENVSLRENQIDQLMKIQSLLANGGSTSSQVQGGTKASTVTTTAAGSYEAPQAVERGADSATAVARQRRGSASVSTALFPFGAAGTLNPPSKATTNDLGLGVSSRDVETSSGRSLRRQHSSGTTPPSSPKRKENSSGNLSTSGDDDSASKTLWFYHMIGLSSSQQQLQTNEPTSRKKPQQQPEVPDEDASLSFLEQKQFLVSLLMSEKQVLAAQAQSKVRRQGNVPTISPPLLPASGTNQSSEKKAATATKKRKPANASGDGNSPEELRDMVTVCRQLVWFFYQRFLMAEEVQTLSTTRSSHHHKKVSLASIVLHFFFERKSNSRKQDEAEALHDAARFVKCLRQVWDEAGDVRFFCEFLDGARSREELCFFLWVLQAIEDTKIGISYETPIANSGGGPTTATRSTTAPAVVLEGEPSLPHICLLKATFLTRIINRLFHVKALKRTASSSATTLTKRKTTGGSGSSTRILPTSPSKKEPLGLASPTSSPRKKRKSRLSEEDPAASKLSQVVSHSASSNNLQLNQRLSHLDHAAARFRSAVAMNNGAPLTLEAFNALLTQFAVSPTTEELQIRLGPFFHPTGDERKLAVEVFLTLIMEMFAHQLAWRKKQMRNLFIALAQHLEAEEVARQLRANELVEAAAGAKGKRVNATPSPKKSSKAAKSPSASSSAKPKKQKKKSKKRDHAHDPSSSKYLMGLTRALLRQFLTYAGIVSDILQVDVDLLFVEILELSGRSAKEIHFDELYDILAKMDWLGNRDLQVDPTTCVFNQQWQSTEDEAKAAMLARLRDLWAVHSRQSLALCENDPNVFVRKRAKLLSGTISRSLALPSSLSVQPNHHFWHSLQSIREFLGFSWRIASKRAGEFQVNQARAERAIAPSTNQRGRPGTAPHWFMSEFFFLNQAIHVVADFPGYQHPSTLLLMPDKDASGDNDSYSSDSASATVALNDLRCFWDTSQLKIDDLVSNAGAQAAGNQPVDGDKAIVMELEHVLKRFCVYVAHLYASYTTAAFNFAGLALHDWLRMARELRRAGKKLPDLNAAHDLFFQVHSQEPSLSAVNENGRQTDFRSEGQLHDDVWLSKSQFTELLVRVAIAKAQKREEKKHPALKFTQNSSTSGLRRPAQIVADFCHQVVVPTAFQQRERLQEVDFVGKLSCPLVSRVLLEHRAFLRVVFFYYAKQDGDEGRDDDDEHERQHQEDTHEKRPPHVDNNHAALQDSVLHGFQLGKTKRNSMNFDEFQAFLAAFELLAEHGGPPPSVDLESAQLVFCSVMALENGDTTQMEFDEFTAAVAALAAYRDPSPFRLWHVKIDGFVQEMHRLVVRNELRFD